jgi:Lycopene cyclase
MNKYTYCYLIGAGFNLGLWAVLFAWRKDLRREMCVMSGLAVVMGLPHEYFLWTRDWWHAPNLTHTRIGFEDALYAIGTGGTFAAVYPALSRRRLVVAAAPSRLAACTPLLLNFTLPFILVAALDMHSFNACALATAAALLWILPARPDLIAPCVLNTALALVLSFSCFWLIESITPGFVAAIWDLPKLSGIVFAGVPIEDLGWYAYTAALFAVYFKYATGSRFVPATQAASSQPLHAGIAE